MLLTNNLLTIQNESQPGSQVKTVNHTRTFYLGINCQNFLFWCTIDQSLLWDKINLMADVFAPLPTTPLKHLLLYMEIAPSKHLQVEVQYIHTQLNTP